MILSGISRLRFSGYPSAICPPITLEALATMPTRVVAVIVDSIDRILSRRSLAHIGNETLKVVPPTGANLYSPAAIVMVGCTTFSFASFYDFQPDIVFWRFGKTVGGISFCQILWLLAAAGIIITLSQVAAAGACLVTAFAHTSPHCLSLPTFSRSLNDGEFPDFLARHINQLPHCLPPNAKSALAFAEICEIPVAKTLFDKLSIFAFEASANLVSRAITIPEWSKNVNG